MNALKPVDLFKKDGNIYIDYSLCLFMVEGAYVSEEDLYLPRKQKLQEIPELLVPADLLEYFSEHPGLEEELADSAFAEGFMSIIYNIPTGDYDEFLNNMRRGIIWDECFPIFEMHLARFPIAKALFLNDKNRQKFTRDFFAMWEARQGRHGFVSMGVGTGANQEMHAIATGRSADSGKHAPLTEIEQKNVYAHLIQCLATDEKLQKETLGTDNVMLMNLLYLSLLVNTDLLSATTDEIQAHVLKYMPNAPLFARAFASDPLFRKQWLRAYEENRIDAIVEHLAFSPEPASEESTEKSGLVHSWIAGFRDKVGKVRERMADNNFDRVLGQIEAILGGKRTLSKQVRNTREEALLRIFDERSQRTGSGHIRVELYVYPHRSYKGRRLTYVLDPDAKTIKKETMGQSDNPEDHEEAGTIKLATLIDVFKDDERKWIPDNRKQI